MSYEHLLRNAPDHESEAFIDYLRDNNPVILETKHWIVIENYKYHTLERSWYTAFWKGNDSCKNPGCCNWFQDVDELWYHGDWEEWEWLKKPASEQSVKRFHIHIHK